MNYEIFDKIVDTYRTIYPDSFVTDTNKIVYPYETIHFKNKSEQIMHMLTCINVYVATHNK